MGSGWSKTTQGAHRPATGGLTVSPAIEISRGIAFTSRALMISPAIEVSPGFTFTSEATTMGTSAPSTAMDVVAEPETVTVGTAVGVTPPAVDARRTQLSESVCSAIVAAVSAESAKNAEMVRLAVEAALVAERAHRTSVGARPVVAASSTTTSAPNRKLHTVREPWFSMLESGRKTADIRRTGVATLTSVEVGEELTFSDPATKRSMNVRVVRVTKYAGENALARCLENDGVEKVFPGFTAEQARVILETVGWKLDEVQRTGIELFEFARV